MVALDTLLSRKGAGKRKEAQSGRHGACGELRWATEQC